MRKSNRELSQEEIAEELGVSRQFVTQVEKKALAKLRRRFGKMLMEEMERDPDDRSMAPGCRRVTLSDETIDW